MTPACVTCAANLRAPRVQCEPCIAEIGKLYRKICTVTARYDFAEPVTPEDLAHVRSELAAALPPGHIVELATRPARVLLAVGYPSGIAYYRREFIVLPG